MPQAQDKTITPRRHELQRLADLGGSLHGRVPGGALQRLAGDLTAPPGDVQWTARITWQGQPGREPELCVDLQAGCTVALTCQRCLQPMSESLQVDRRFRLVEDEAQAEALDESCDDDVLALRGGDRLDLEALVEDELILALPLVPRHVDCGMPASARAAPAPTDEPARPRPFDVLASLKTGQGKEPS